MKLLLPKPDFTDTRLFQVALLCLVVLPIIANFFAFDVVVITTTSLKDYFLVDNSEIGLLLALYQLPNCVVPLLGGNVMAKLGAARTAVIMIALCVLGNVLSVVGFRADSLPLFRLSRFVFGLGGECLLMCIDVMITVYFNGSSLSFAYGVLVSAQRVGGLLALFACPLVATEYGFLWNYYLATILLSIGGALLVALFYLEGNTLFRVKSADEDDTIAAVENPPISLAQGLKHLSKNLDFWFYAFIGTLFYSALYSFLAFTPDWLIAERGLPQADAGFMCSLIMLGSTILSPIFGHFVDKFGHRCHLLIFSFTISAVGFILPIFFEESLGCVYLCFAFVAIGLSLFPCVFAGLLPLIVPDETMFSQCYSITYGFFNTGTFLSYYLMGLLSELYGYWAAFGMLAFMTAAAFVLGCILWVRDKKGLFSLTASELHTDTLDCNDSQIEGPGTPGRNRNVLIGLINHNEDMSNRMARRNSFDGGRSSSHTPNNKHGYGAVNLYD